jgi:hypothetical protein
VTKRRGVVSLSPGFAAQFDPDGADYVYRHAYRGAAIPVSAAERDAFVAAFNRAVGLQVLAAGVGFLALLVLTIRLIFVPLAYLIAAIVAASLVLTGLVMTIFWRAWQTPARALSGRAPVAPPLTPAEARRAANAKMTWPQIAFGVLITLFFAERAAVGAPPLGSGVWLCMTAFGLFATSYGADKAWRARREPPTPGQEA